MELEVIVSREGETQTYYSTDSYHCWLLCTPTDCNATHNKFIRAVFPMKEKCLPSPPPALISLSTQFVEVASHWQI